MSVTSNKYFMIKDAVKKELVWLYAFLDTFLSFIVFDAICYHYITKRRCSHQDIRFICSVSKAPAILFAV